VKRSVVIIGTLLLLLAMSTSGHATPTIWYTTYAPGGEFVSPYVATTTWDFNGGALPSGWTGNAADAAIVSNSQSGQYAAPEGVSGQDTSKYIVVPGSGQSGSVTVTNFGSANYFGIWWGSIDTYNSLTFYNGSTQVAYFTGSDVSTSPNGDWTSSETNKYVNFTGFTFDKFVMASSGIAFEADNIAVGNVSVPEPITLLFLGASLFGLGLAGRKIKK